MLDEAEVKVKVKALEKLDAVVPDFWAEISDALSEIECLYEDESFPQRGLAALVASKVYYYLGELGDALTYALGAGQLFNVDEGSEYVDTLLAKAIDEYCGLHVARYERAVKAERGGEVEAEVAIDGRLVELVERMMESAITKRAYTLVMGIAIESRQLAAVERLVRLCGTAPGDGEHEGGVSPMLEYVFSPPMARRRATSATSSSPCSRRCTARSPPPTSSASRAASPTSTTPRPSPSCSSDSSAAPATRSWSPSR